MRQGYTTRHIGGYDQTTIAVSHDTTDNDLTLLGEYLLDDAHVIPLQDAGIASKKYVDGLLSGVVIKPPVKFTSTQSLSLEPFAVSGVTYIATGTNPHTPARLVQTNPADGVFSGLDGVVATLNDRVLIKDQTNANHNGIYYIKNLGSVGVPWELERTTDADETGEINGGTSVFDENSKNTYLTYGDALVDIDNDPKDFVLFSNTVLDDLLVESGIYKNGNTIGVTNYTNINAHVTDTNNPHASTLDNIGDGVTYNKILATEKTAYNAHIVDTNNPHSSTLDNIGDGVTYNKILATEKTAYNAHIVDTNNPHSSTLDNIGDGVTYNKILATEKTAYNAHIVDTNNPHSSTLDNIGDGVTYKKILATEEPKFMYTDGTRPMTKTLRAWEGVQGTVPSASLKSHAPYTTDKLLQYNAGNNSVFDELGTPTVNQTTERLEMFGYGTATHQKLRYLSANNIPASTRVGCIRVGFAPNFSGSPSTDQQIISIDNGSNQNNMTEIWITPLGANGTLKCACHKAGGASVATLSAGIPISMVAGTVYDIEFNFNTIPASSLQEMYFNGLRLDFSTNDDANNKDEVGLTYITIGNDNGAQYADFALDYFSIFDTVQHTGASYTPSLPEYDGVQMGLGFADKSTVGITHEFSPVDLNTVGNALCMYTDASGFASKGIGITPTRVEVLKALDMHNNNVVNAGLINGVDINNILASDVTMLNTPLSGFSSVQEMQDTFHSSGWVSGGVLSSLGNGQAYCTGGNGFIRNNTTELSPLYFISWPPATLTLTDNAVNNIVVDYNGGSPAVSVGPLTNDYTQFLIGKIYREGIILEIDQNNIHKVGDHALRMINRLEDLAPYSRASGGVLSFSGLNILISAGSFWNGLNKFNTSSYDSSVVGFSYWWADGVGGWSTNSTNTINNAQYDDGTGTLPLLSNNKYGVHWVYLSTTGKVHVLYGNGDYTLQEAQASQSPAILPPRLFNVRLIGRVIILKSATSIHSVQSAFQSNIELTQANTADSISYNNGVSGLTAVDVQDAIDEVNNIKVSKSGDSMTGALNMTNNAITNINYLSGNGGALSVDENALNLNVGGTKNTPQVYFIQNSAVSANSGAVGLASAPDQLVANSATDDVCIACSATKSICLGDLSTRYMYVSSTGTIMGASIDMNAFNITGATSYNGVVLSAIPIANVSGLQTSLDGKASTVHTHVIGDVTNLQTTLDGKASTTHTHVIGDVTGLQTALDGKLNLSGGTMSGVLNMNSNNISNITSLNGYTFTSPGYNKNFYTTPVASLTDSADVIIGYGGYFNRIMMLSNQGPGGVPDLSCMEFKLAVSSGDAFHVSTVASGYSCAPDITVGAITDVAGTVTIPLTITSFQSSPTILLKIFKGTAQLSVRMSTPASYGPLEFKHEASLYY